jgi:HPt (histidine-containing phosphotransfer) domain-containing protein
MTQMNTHSTECQTPIHSTFADDETMAELVEMFVDDLPDRIETIQGALGSADIELLHRTAHQLKGAFGSYGFHELTEPARKLEQSTSAGDDNLDSIRRDVSDLIACCRRITASAAPN